MRLIDADKLKKHYAWWEDDRQKLFDEIVNQQPTVDAVPVIHGKRIDEYPTADGMDQCSECDMRLIDADALIRKLRRYGVPSDAWVIDEINNAQKIEAVPVVRCEDCVRYFYGVCTLHGGPFSPDACYVSEDGYCAMGKRRTE